MRQLGLCVGREHFVTVQGLIKQAELLVRALGFQEDQRDDVLQAAGVAVEADGESKIVFLFHEQSSEVPSAPSAR